jgi:hypothetical protein
MVCGVVDVGLLCLDFEAIEWVQGLAISVWDANL